MGLLEIGRIVRCHGLAGRVKVLSYLDSQDVLNNLPEVFVGRRSQETVPFSLDAVQPGRDFFILKLGGIEDRDAAAKLVRSSVWMPSEKMKKLPEGEYYWREIIGLRVVTEEGQIPRQDRIRISDGKQRCLCLPGSGEGDPASRHR